MMLPTAPTARTLLRTLALLPLLLACSLVSGPVPPTPGGLPPQATPGSTPTPPPPGPGPTATPPSASTGLAPYIDVSGAGYPGVIVPAERGAEFGIFKATGYWTPGLSDVEAFESAFPVWIGKQTVWGADVVAERWPDDYVRQYVGFERDAAQYVYVNALCPTDFMDWQTQPIFVMDGGPCFFSVVYNPTTGDFLDLMINGIA